jgi:hypothetical protein
MKGLKSKKTVEKLCSVKQRDNSARKTSGRPFQKGNPYAFKPGQSGNPNGRPKTRTLSEAYRVMLGQPLPNDPKGRTFADCIAETIGLKAARGDVIAAKEIEDRVSGRPKQTVDVTIEEKKRELVNNAIEALMSEAGIQRDEAIEQLTTLAPEVSELIH